VVHCLTAHHLVLTVSAKIALSQPVVAIQLQMWSAMGAALCAVRMQDVLKVDACIRASDVLHVSHGTGSFGSSPSLHLHAPYLSMLLMTIIVVAVYISRVEVSRLKLCGTRTQPGLTECAMQ